MKPKEPTIFQSLVFMAIIYVGMCVIPAFLLWGVVEIFNLLF